MFLVSKRARRRLAASLGFFLALASIWASASIAEERSRVLTVEAAGGPEAVVHDTVKVALETGTKSKFITSQGEISCAKSEMAGEITSNPVSGSGKAEIKIEAFTFRECATNIVGLTVKGVEIETFPLDAVTRGTTAFEITEKGINVSFVFTVEKGGVESICIFRALFVEGIYRNNSEGEMEIDRVLNNGFTNRLNCGSGQLTTPTWKAAYRPLHDETGVRAGKQIFLN